MNKSQEPKDTLFRLIRSVLRNETEVLLPEDVDWNRLFDQRVAVVEVDGLQGSLELRGHKSQTSKLSALNYKLNRMRCENLLHLSRCQYLADCLRLHLSAHWKH